MLRAGEEKPSLEFGFDTVVGWEMRWWVLVSRLTVKAGCYVKMRQDTSEGSL